MLIRNWNDQIPFLIHSVFIAACLFIWCRLHASENGIEEPSYHPFFCALLPPLGIPNYAYSFFGLKGGTILLAKAVVALLITGVISILFGMAVVKIYV